MPCKEEEDEINRWSSESRDKLAWLCRVQPIFNEVNRDRGRQSQPMEQRRGETDVWANRNHGYTA